MNIIELTSELYSSLCIPLIKKDKHRNIKNYLDLDLSLYSSPLLALLDDAPIGFSMVQQYDDKEYITEYKHARILTRTYYFTEFRNKGLWSFHRKHFNTLMEDYFPNIQIKWAIENNYDSVFVSTEFLSRRKSCESFVKAMNSKTDLNWITHPDMICTCRSKKNGINIGLNMGVSCWQNVGYALLNPNATFDLPKMENKNWIELYHGKT